MNDEPEEIGIPEWVVTFGDMMSLLLTFFIMLVSLSEIKDDETYQKLVDSVQREFGYSRSADSLSPGKKRPRKTEFTPLATTGRAKRKDTTRGGVPVKAPAGEEPRVRIVRPGQLTAVGSVIFFQIGKATLSPTARTEIKQLADKLRGKPQKIEIRGHVSPAKPPFTNAEPPSTTMRAVCSSEILVGLYNSNQSNVPCAPGQPARLQGTAPPGS